MWGGGQGKRDVGDEGVGGGYEGKKGAPGVNGRGEEGREEGEGEKNWEKSGGREKEENLCA